MTDSLYHDESNDDATAGPGTVLSNDHVVVIGGGTMGAGIAASLLAVNARVTLVETSSDFATAANARVEDSLARMARRNDELDTKETLSRFHAGLVHPTDAVALVIEAVPEDLALKQKIFSSIADHYADDVVFASNTSSLSITAIAEEVPRPERLVGMHFFNPVPVSSLVEVVVGSATQPRATEVAVAWTERLGKTPIVVNDSPGFASSRLGIALGMEAIRMLEEGVASADDIDAAMELGYKHPMGPLRLTDLIGLDVRLAIAEHLSTELGDRFDPPQLLRDLVARGDLGKKSGKGFHDWS